MKKRLFFVMLVMLLLLAGCSGSENAQVEEESQGETPQKSESDAVDEETQATSETTSKTGEQTKADEQEEVIEVEEPKLDEERTQAVKDDMYENYGTPGYEASWYSLIKDIRVYEKSVYIDTSIYPDEEGKKTAQLICNTVAYSKYVTEDDFITVNSQNGLPIASCYRLN